MKDTRSQRSDSVRMKVSRDELTILQGRKQFGRTLGSVNAETIEHRVLSVSQMFYRAGKIQEPNPIHLVQIGIFLKDRYPFLMLGDIQPMFYLSSKGVIKRIERVELGEIAEVAEEYWKYVEKLIMKMREAVK